MTAVSATPTSYAEVASQWTPFIYNVALRSGIPREDLEDVKQDILADFIDRDALSYFDPAVAPFPAFLRSFTVKRCYRARREILRLRQRSPLLLDRPVSDDEGSEETYAEVFLGNDDPLVDWIMERSQIHAFRDYLDADAVSLVHRIPFSDLGDLFNWVAHFVLFEHENIERWTLAEVMAVPRYRIDKMMVALRAVADGYGFGRR